MKIDIATSDEPKPEAKAEEEVKEESAPQETDEQKEVSESGTEEGKDEVEESEESKDSEDESEESKEEKPRKPKKNGFQRRIAKMTAKNKELEAELERLKRESSRDDTEKVEKKPEEGKPKSDDYESYEDYLDALADWKAEQKFEAKFKEYTQKQNQEKIQNEHHQKIENYNQKQAEFAETHDDYFDVIESVDDVPVSPALMQAIVDNGPELAYELAKNRDEMERINSLPPSQLWMELGMIKARLTKPQKEKKTTKAPTPIAPVKSKGGKVQKDPEDMTQKEYEAWRQKHA